jgi:CPA1 family monovalent cation:H+ antiporter
MSLFDSLLVLLLIALVLLQLARQFSLPYPAMLAAAGVAIALIPGAPEISIDPATSLGLFIAPAVVDAAYTYPLKSANRFRLPLIAYAVFAVIFTAIAVAFISKAFLALPLSAGMALGAIVGPPDAAAAVATLKNYCLPRRTGAVLKGESLFNDATALLLFSGSLLVLDGGFSLRVALRLLFAPPGGILLGILCAYLVRTAGRVLRDTLGGTLFQFIAAYLVWIVAQHLGLSAVLCEIAYAMTLARITDARDIDTRMRVQSFAVWDSVVFTLNVVAFLLMGMQAHSIVLRTSGHHLRHALTFAAAVSLAVISIRLFTVLAFTRLERWWKSKDPLYPASNPGGAFFVGWCGMRGFVTIATAFALPSWFPHRDTVVLAAFAVVLVTLVLQGITVAPLLEALKLDQKELRAKEEKEAHVAMAQAALASLTGLDGPEAENVRYRFSLKLPSDSKDFNQDSSERVREVGLKALQAERNTLNELLDEDKIDPPTFVDLQEELDWHELALLRDVDRHIEEI